jgi:hypothetical protein
MYLRGRNVSLPRRRERLAVNGRLRRLILHIGTGQLQTVVTDLSLFQLLEYLPGSDLDRSRGFVSRVGMPEEFW